MHDNIRRLVKVANGLGELRDEMVFVGGTVVSLYANDEGAYDIRPTTDVDCIIELATYGYYENLEDRLRNREFVNDFESGVICRWKYRGETVDIMPNDEKILGFSNYWYKRGYDNKKSYQLTSDLRIYLLPITYFIAAKIEALNSRGGDDWRYSKDFEDIVFLLNNRTDIIKIVKDEEDDEVRELFSKWAKTVLNRPNHIEEIECVLPYGEMERKDYILGILNELIAV